MPKSVPPLPWKMGWRRGPEPGASGGGPAGGAGRRSGGPGGSGGAGGIGTVGAGGGGASGLGGPGLPAGAGLRKNDGRPAGSCPSTIRPDYGRNRRGESTFGGQSPRLSLAAKRSR